MTDEPKYVKYNGSIIGEIHKYREYGATYYRPILTIGAMTIMEKFNDYATAKMWILWKRGYYEV